MKKPEISKTSLSLDWWTVIAAAVIVAGVRVCSLVDLRFTFPW